MKLNKLSCVSSKSTACKNYVVWKGLYIILLFSVFIFKYKKSYVFNITLFLVICTILHSCFNDFDAHVSQKSKNVAKKYCTATTVIFKINYFSAVAIMRIQCERYKTIYSINEDLMKAIFWSQYHESMVVLKRWLSDSYLQGI